MTNSDPSDANNVGQVVGQSAESNTFTGKPFLWQGGTMTPLSALAVYPPGGTPNVVHAINENGTILYRRTNGKTGLLRPVGVAAADVDINCRVDAEDLKLVLLCWGDAAAAPARRADVNGDGTVDAYDIAEILGEWTP